MPAVLPVSHRLALSELRAGFGDPIDMANETEVNRLFPGCADGAVPAVGTFYGADVRVDDGTRDLLEADHKTLLHLNHAQFARFIASTLHGRISAHH